jgi:ribosomal protein L11 methyltransferase
VSGWRRTVLAALVDATADPHAVLADAAAALGRDAPAVLEVRHVADRDWVRLTQSQFEPIPIGERLVITPSWHASDDPARIEIVLDPGLAFGTGSHPTTRLCLQWLERHLPAGATVIDYGCGSGILAIAAARLGAASVVGVDIDPQALVATRDNAARNRAETLAVRATTDARPEPADVVVANILANPCAAGSASPSSTASRR